MIRAGDVAALLDTVEPPRPVDAHAAVRAVAAGLDAFVGWEDAEVAVLLLPAHDGPCPEIHLRHLDVLPATNVVVRVPGSLTTQTRRVAVLRCRFEQSGVQLAFENVAAALCSRLDDEGALDLSVQIPSLERLFAAFREDALTAIIGLWAELALIAHATDVVAVARAWHGDPRDVFDFRHDEAAVEVKASRDAAREHWISLDQWRAGKHARCELASMVVVPLDDGTSVADLIERVEAALAAEPALQSKVLEVSARTLGRDFGRASMERYDLESALKSLRFVPLGDVPHATFDPGVLDARWRASLEHVDWNNKATWGAIRPICV